MHLIEATPFPCANCGAGNATDQAGNKRQFIDLERDINWNDPLILCEDCVLKLAGMLGYPSPELLAGLKQDLRGRDTEIHELKSEIDLMKRRATKLGIEFTGKKKTRVAA